MYVYTICLLDDIGKVYLILLFVLFPPLQFPVSVILLVVLFPPLQFPVSIDLLFVLFPPLQFPVSIILLFVLFPPLQLQVYVILLFVLFPPLQFPVYVILLVVLFPPLQLPGYNILLVVLFIYKRQRSSTSNLETQIIETLKPLFNKPIFCVNFSNRIDSSVTPYYLTLTFKTLVFVFKTK